MKKDDGVSDCPLSHRERQPGVKAAQARSRGSLREGRGGEHMPSLVKWLLVQAALFAAVVGCSSDSDALLVFAATSLTDSLAEITPAFEEESGARVSISLGGSQLLARQIVSGAPADVFFAAGVPPMELLSSEGLLGSGVEAIMTNDLVLVTRPGLGIESLAGLLESSVERIALADPDLAPAGVYAQQALTSFGLWDRVSEKLIKANDVRATLSYIETGNADAALVYRTDAASARNVEVYDVISPYTYAQIIYPAAVIERSEKKETAAEFLAYLKRDGAQAIFRRHGFETVGR